MVYYLPKMKSFKTTLTTKCLPSLQPASCAAAWFTSPLQLFKVSSSTEYSSVGNISFSFATSHVLSYTKNLIPRVSTFTVNKLIVMAVELKKNSNCLCTITKHFTEQLAMYVTLKMVQCKSMLPDTFTNDRVDSKYSHNSLFTCKKVRYT